MFCKLSARISYCFVRKFYRVKRISALRRGAAFYYPPPPTLMVITEEPLSLKMKSNGPKNAVSKMAYQTGRSGFNSFPTEMIADVIKTNS